MNYKAHTFAGACSGAIATSLIYQGDVNTSMLLTLALPTIIGGAIGGLLPDTDLPTSKLGRKIYPISWLINKMFGHRGFTHSILCAILVSVMFYLPVIYYPDILGITYRQIVIGISAGYISHLLLDMSTTSGVPLLHPFTKKSYRISKLKTGKHDLFVSVAFLVVTLAIVGRSFVF